MVCVVWCVLCVVCDVWCVWCVMCGVFCVWCVTGGVCGVCGVLYVCTCVCQPSATHNTSIPTSSGDCLAYRSEVFVPNVHKCGL